MKFCLTLLCSFFLQISFAQTDPLLQAKLAMDMKDYPKAVSLFEELYKAQPADDDVYDGYLQSLLLLKDYKAALTLTESRQKMRPQNPMILLDIGGVYTLMGKDKKAREAFDLAVSAVNGDDMLTTRLAHAFSTMKQDDYAILVYEKARELLRNNAFYSSQLARLYARKGNAEKAVITLLDAGPAQPGGVEDTKATLLEMLGADAAKLLVAQKAIIKRINAQPENTFYAEILTWLYTQRDDWDGALLQIAALDARLKEGGQRLVSFARNARREQQWDVALRALDVAAEEAKDSPVFPITRAEALAVKMERLRDNGSRTPQEMEALNQEFDTFLKAFPQYRNTETLRDYAELLAQYAGKPQEAVALLDDALKVPTARREFDGLLRLQLGDYLILTGNVWEASLRYSQVDKDFREDVLGEEARFRNAKLAWYRGDFEWAQLQLDVLKASTSELIANDALYLSVLITENIPPDSNLLPLERFAAADLLLFQNHDAAAAALLDSISQAFPKHPLQDDILMQQAKIARRKKDFTGAGNLYAQVYEMPKAGEKKDDLLADDALFNAAEMTERNLKNPEQAKTLYEQLILRFPGSTFVQRARERLDIIEGKTTPL